MRPVRILQIVLGIAILALIAVQVLSPRFGRRSGPSATPTYGTVQDFEFVDQDNRPFGRNDLKGKVWIADFFFTQCMGPCPLLTTRMAELQKDFSNKTNLRFVSFSVDPTHDTSAVLKKYAATYGAHLNNWHFLTGDKEKIFKLVRESFHLAVEQTPPTKPSENDILHSLYFVLVDANGTIVGYYDSTDNEALKQMRDGISRT